MDIIIKEKYTRLIETSRTKTGWGLLNHKYGILVFTHKEDKQNLPK
jgi:hypothetical protein